VSLDRQAEKILLVSGQLPSAFHPDIRIALTKNRRDLPMPRKFDCRRAGERIPHREEIIGMNTLLEYSTRRASLLVSDK